MIWRHFPSACFECLNLAMNYLWSSYNALPVSKASLYVSLSLSQGWVNTVIMTQPKVGWVRAVLYEKLIRTLQCGERYCPGFHGNDPYFFGWIAVYASKVVGVWEQGPWSRLAPSLGVSAVLQHGICGQIFPFSVLGYHRIMCSLKPFSSGPWHQCRGVDGHLGPDFSVWMSA